MKPGAFMRRKIVEPGTRFILVNGEPVVVGSLVQVVELENRLFGIALIVGDFTESEIHGFYTSPKSRTFATVPVSACRYVGESHVKSREPCSKEWLAKHTPQTNEERSDLRHRNQEGSAGKEETQPGGD